MVIPGNNSAHSEKEEEDFTEEQYAPLTKRHRSTASEGPSNQWASVSDVFTPQSTQSPQINPSPQFSQSPQISQSTQFTLSPQLSPVEDELPPLGLVLRKTPSLLDLIQSKLSERNKTSKPGEAKLGEAKPGEASTSRGKKSSKAKVSKNAHDKLKASNFPASLLRIGTWEYVSRYEGDLVAKCYFAKHKLVWEVLDGGLKSKIEMQWSDIVALKAECSEENPCTLTIVLAREPVFYRETNPQPRKHTLWQASTDFTNKQATINRIHYLECPPGSLTKHYEKLIQCDTRLGILSQQPERVLCSPHFEPQTPVENPEDSSRGGRRNQQIAGQGTSLAVSDIPMGDVMQLASFSFGSNPMAGQYTSQGMASSNLVMDPNIFVASESLNQFESLETLGLPALPHSNGGGQYNQMPATVIGSSSSAYGNLPSVTPVQLPSLHSGHNPMSAQLVFREMASPTIQGNRNVDTGQKGWERSTFPKHFQSNGVNGWNQLATTTTGTQSNGVNGWNQLATTTTGTQASGFENPLSVSNAMQLHSSGLGHNQVAAQGLSKEVPLPNPVTAQANNNSDRLRQGLGRLVRPGLTRSESYKKIVDHAEFLAINMIPKTYPSDRAIECKHLLDDISDVLLSDTTQTTVLDEPSLMKKVNSLCCLLDDPNPPLGSAAADGGNQSNQSKSVDDHDYEDVFPDFMAGASEDSNLKWDSEWDFADCGPSEHKMATGLQRKDSYVDMLYNLPRIASLPRFASG